MRALLIVNDEDFDGFYEEVRNLRAMGLAFIFNYIQEINAPGRPRPGGWAGVEFVSGVLPPGRLFDERDVEYRYSDDLKGWLRNGELADAEDQTFITGLYEYFTSLNGGQE